MKPTQKNDVTTVLVSLADKSSELRSMSNQEMIDLCKQLLSCLYNRESEWSEADSWRFKEAQLLGLISSKANDKDDDAEKIPINDEDYITSRILRLTGLEEGINRGANVDSYSRYIYIHGTPHRDKLGSKQSHGCIRMSDNDVFKLFEMVELKTLVLID